MADKNTPAFRGTVTAIPEGKGTPEEHKAMKDFYSGDDNIYAAGINVGRPGFYDPEAGAEKHPIRRPESDPKPLLVTDPGQPKVAAVDVVSRERNSAVDKTEKPVVKSTGRKAPTSKG